MSCMVGGWLEDGGWESGECVCWGGGSLTPHMLSNQTGPDLDGLCSPPEPLSVNFQPKEVRFYDSHFPSSLFSRYYFLWD